MSDLKQRIKVAQQKSNKVKNDPKNQSSFGFLRISIDLVSSIVVGIGIGFFVDEYFDSKPIAMIVGFFLGSISGFLSIYRLNQQMKKS
jgi:ATP synthase protein I